MFEVKQIPTENQGLDQRGAIGVLENKLSARKDGAHRLLLRRLPMALALRPLGEKREGLRFVKQPHTTTVRTNRASDADRMQLPAPAPFVDGRVGDLAERPYLSRRQHFFGATLYSR
jgi:hypothetical protein